MMLVNGDDRMIEYRGTHGFAKNELEHLFLSVNWSSGHFPDKLVVAMKNYETVFSAWDNDALVGLICAMDDGIMNAYVHYLLVNPAFQGQGIGRRLVDMVKDKYKGYLRMGFCELSEDHGTVRMAKDL